jgi:Ca2+-binding RTX toxin-like protein
MIAVPGRRPWREEGETMPQIRTLGAASALVAAGVVVLSSVAVAHPGPHYGPFAFDDVEILTMEADVYTAPDGSRDKIVGKAGDDELWAGDKRDLVLGNRGDDEIHGGAGSDKIHGGIGADDLYGDEDADKIIGGLGADYIDGGAGRDIIKAGRGDDVIVANDGERDLIYCGPGDDTVTADAEDRVSPSCEDVTQP